MAWQEGEEENYLLPNNAIHKGFVIICRCKMVQFVLYIKGLSVFQSFCGWKIDCNVVTNFCIGVSCLFIVENKVKQRAQIKCSRPFPSSQGRSSKYTCALGSKNMDHQGNAIKPWRYWTRKHLRTDFSSGGSQYMEVYCCLQTWWW